MRPNLLFLLIEKYVFVNRFIWTKKRPNLFHLIEKPSIFFFITSNYLFQSKKLDLATNGFLEIWYDGFTVGNYANYEQKKP